MGSTSSVITFRHTATDDLPFRLTSYDIPFFEANFYIATHALVYGDATAQNAPQAAGTSFWFDKGNLKDVWFKNAGAGNNTVITVVATIPNLETLKALGLVV